MTMPAPDARPRWEAGLCPCCGGELCAWPGPDGTDVQPAPIAEGVTMCGRCIGNHHNDPETTQILLKALVTT